MTVEKVLGLLEDDGTRLPICSSERERTNLGTNVIIRQRQDRPDCVFVRNEECPGAVSSAARCMINYCIYFMRTMIELGIEQNIRAFTTIAKSCAEDVPLRH